MCAWSGDMLIMGGGTGIHGCICCVMNGAQYYQCANYKPGQNSRALSALCHPAADSTGHIATCQPGLRECQRTCGASALQPARQGGRAGRQVHTAAELPSAGLQLASGAPPSNNWPQAHAPPVF